VTASTNVSSMFSFGNGLSLSVSQMQSFMTQFIVNLSQMASFGNNFSLNSSQMRAFYQGGNTVFARNTVTDVITNLGFINEDDAQVIVDAPLADGSYSIEVRPSGTLWREARTKQILSVTITAGVVEFTGIPAIKNLDSLILNNFNTRVIWQVGDEYNLQDITFGLWRSAISPVVVTGPPDETVAAINGSGTYFIDITQTAAEFVAVAAIGLSDQGPESEIALAFDTVAPPLT